MATLQFPPIQVPDLKIDLSNVQHVYVGRTGCACGCNGKHYYPERHRENWKELRGWGPFEDKDISDKQVARITRLIEDTWNNKSTGRRIDMCHSGFISAVNDSNTRTWTVYLEKRIPGLPDFSIYNMTYTRPDEVERIAKVHEQVERKTKAIAQLKDRGSVDCACGQVITPVTPYVEVGADGVLWHGNAEGGGHRADVEP